MVILRHWKKILLSVLVLAVLAATIGIPYAFARLITHAGTRPMDLELTSTPADYGVDFEPVSFTSADGVALSGWYLGGAGSEVAVACGHGLFRSRREVLDRAVFFRKLGLDTLVFDFRRHGESAGDEITLGYDERRDFEAAADFLRARRPGRRVVLFGVSMGAAAALLAAAETEAVAAVIADSSFSSLEHTVVHHVKLIFGLPRFPFASSLLFFLEHQAGFDRSEFDLERAVAAIDRPVLVIAGGQDERMPANLQHELYDASSSPLSVFAVFPEARHGAAYRVDPERYETIVKGFLSEAGLLPKSPEPAATSDEDSSLSSR